MNVHAQGELEALRAQVHRLQAELAAARSERRDAQQVARTKDEFLAMVAHELRAPLAAILGWAHMVRERGTMEEFGNALTVIEQSAHVQMKLIEDLLVMTRVANSRMSLDIQPLDPRGFIEAAVNSVVPAAAEKGLRISSSFDTKAGPVRGDATRLQQVLGNLLTNAVKFTPERGAIEITLKRSRGWAVIGVRDEGVGISASFLPHVFDRFRQDPSTARSHNGLGLGLAIARQLVELHGGEIEAHSEGEGRGALFVVRLPIAEVR
ncbi:MAG TPA: HAMP domain-containing sensor histidine kinase [Ramlibacter sp.]|nr:HAMP domain-containing sensor histidine kinase [Ramlibacter sp.]